MRARLPSLFFSPWLTAGGLAVAVGVPLWFWLGSVYDGSALWPGLAGNFSASFFAFILALTWDRQQARTAGVARVREEGIALRREAETQHARRSAEVQRRFRAILAELRENQSNIDRSSLMLVGDALVLPPLLRGAWAANAQSLSVLVADSDLIGDLSTFYGRVEELQWRLRYRAELMVPGRSELLKGMTEMSQWLANPMAKEVAARIERVAEQ